MRYGYAMSDGGNHEAAIASAAWLAPVAALASSILTGVLLFLAQRLVGKAAWQAAVTAANKDLIDQLQEERRDLLAERAAERLAWAAERIAWIAERAQQRGEIINLTQALESLKAHLRREGIHVPETVYHPPSEMIVIEGNDE